MRRLLVGALLLVPMAYRGEAQPYARLSVEPIPNADTLPECGEADAGSWLQDMSNGTLRCECAGDPLVCVWTERAIAQPGPAGPEGPPGEPGPEGPAGPPGISVPVKGCIVWGGTLAEIPAGWQLADGTNDMPDLRDRFPRGAAAGQNGGATGGGATHEHDYSQVISHQHDVNVTDPQHSHVEQVNASASGGLSGFAARDTSTQTPSATGYSTQNAATGITATTANPAGSVATGTTATGSSLPPYATVLWVCRTS